MSRSRRLLFAVAAAVPLISGCYILVPLDTVASPPAGKRLAVEITDRGRVALSERLGGGVLRLEGTLAAHDSNQYVMNIWRVAQVNGELTPWSGEMVRIDRNFVGGVFERRLSRSRSYLAAGVAVVALAWFASSQGLFGSADAVAGEPPPPPPELSRIP